MLLPATTPGLCTRAPAGWHPLYSGGDVELQDLGVVGRRCHHRYRMKKHRGPQGLEKHDGKRERMQVDAWANAKMEANREAAMRCLSIATSALAEDDIRKALKFAQKSHDLFPGTASATIITNAARSEANRDAAEQSLMVATRARNGGDLEKALTYARKSRDLCPSVVATTMMLQLTEQQEQERQQRLAEFSQSVTELKKSMEQQQEEQREREQARERERRHQRILLRTFQAWVKVKRDGIETPPEGAAPVDPIELEQLYSELEVLSFSSISTPNMELDLAMQHNSPTCVICDPAEDESHSEAGSEVTQSEVARSVATSAITLESTFHLRQRKSERGISRRELQSTLKHGTAERDPFTGRVIHRHRDITFVTDASCKVGVTTWSEENCKGRGCSRDTECHRGFCSNCCWGCDEHIRCSAPGCTREDVCIRGFCGSCCYGSSQCNCVPYW